MKTFLSSDDRKKISEAISLAEKTVSGEIVPCVLQSSGHYREIFWKSLAIGAFLTSLIVSALDAGHYLGWTNFRWITAVGICLSGGFLFFLLAYLWNGFSRWLVGKPRLKETVNRRAKELFLENELFKTKERTGILILVSLFEHQVVVLGDTGIHKKVQPSDWDHIVEDVISSIHRKKLGEGLILAIEDSKKLLEKHGFIEKTDHNELSNEVLGDR